MGWLKPENYSQCPNIMAMINRFNDESAWVGTMIVKAEILSNRVKMYTKLISIAQYLRDIGNFSALMAFVAGTFIIFIKNSLNLVSLKYRLEYITHPSDEIDAQGITQEVH